MVVRARKRLSNNAIKRAELRAREELVAARERLAKLEPGGDSSRPIDVVSAAVVDVHARSMRCLRCSAESRLMAHTAETIDGRRVRIAALQCAKCGATRSVYFRIAGAAGAN